MEMRKKKKWKRYAAPSIIAAAVVLFVAVLIACVLLSNRPSKPRIIEYVAVGSAVIFGMIYCLRQRIKEIQGGEEDEARKY